MNLTTLGLMGLSYLYGSIPFALVIGKVFYHTDVRNYGSGNLGGTNVGRVLGKKAGVACMVLDIFKCFVCVFLTKLLTPSLNLPSFAIYTSALSCVIGHCYPIFASFKGGKAVSVMFGYCLAIHFWLFAFVGIVFLVVLYLKKYVSLASICGALSLILASFIFKMGVIGFVSNTIIAVLLIYRHRANIERLKNHTESKITWM